MSVIEIIGALLALAFLALYFFGGKVAPATPVLATEDQPAIKATLMELKQAYEKNTVSADIKFKGKRYEFDCIVSEINTDILDNPYLIVDTKDGVIGASLKFKKDELNSLAALSKGDSITVSCVGDGDILKSPNSKDCKIINSNNNISSKDVSSSLTPLTTVDYIDSRGNQYTSAANANGVILKSSDIMIYLGKSCDASSPKYGKGTWSWANGGFVVEFNNASIGFPRQEIKIDNNGGCSM
ncbi:MAG: hypothetical protein WBP13_06290 [Methylophilaceae bacterium]